MNRLSRRFIPAIAGLVYIFSLEPCLSAEYDHVLEMDIRQLMQVGIEVTSVSKRPQKLHEAASAIYVVTQKDIRRTGAVNIMEALRIVPGLLVSKIDQNQYAISARGFNSQFGSNKLLVLMDGRTLYNPSFAGVFWVSQDTVLEDIDRIEVIRGPGAALWGSNAVAGVINIITKDSSKTQGTLVSGGAGTEEEGFGSLRHGGKLGEDFNYRVYGKYRKRDSGKDAFGNDAFDEKEMLQGGFRSDWQVNQKNHLTLQGDYYDFDAEDDTISRFNSFTFPFNQPAPTTSNFVGANFLARWNRTLDKTSNIILQTYYDRTQVDDFFITDESIANQFDLDFQHNFQWGESQKISWGLNYHYTHFDIVENTALVFPNNDTSLFGLFVHDEITLVPKTWSVILGSKFEHNQFSGFEIQPNIRTVWTPNRKNTIWAAVSRAVRIPTEVEDGVKWNIFGIPGAPNVITREIGSPELEAENLLAFELGYRAQISPKLSFDMTGYLNFYDDISDTVLGTAFVEASPAPLHVVQPLIRSNVLEGEAIGAELSVDWKPLNNWRLSGSYSYNYIDLRPTSNAFAGTGLVAEGEPNHLFNVRSYLDLPHNLELDLMLYYQSEFTSRNVDDFTRVDMRLGWKPIEEVEFSLVGQNLLDDQHPEFNNQAQFRTETERSFYAKATFRF